MLAAAAACRQEEITVNREPKEAAAPAAGSAGPGGLHWQAPRNWRELPAAGMRMATFAPPPEAGKAEASIVALPGDVGGELANVNRWRGQLGLAAITEAELARNRQVLRAPAGELRVYDFKGQGTPPSRMIAAMIKARGLTWFFKLMGESKAVEADQPAFLKMLKNLRADEK